MQPINRLERYLHRFRIQPFFQYIVFAMAGVYLLDMFFSQAFLSLRLMLIRQPLFAGELWRILTFLIVPPAGSNILTVALTLYFYYFVGTALENRWGARRFLLYYIIGALAALIAGLITGFGTNMYLNLSLFFAFAIQYPDFQLLLFFVLPIKVKWLALLNGLFFLFGLVNGNWPTKVAILLSLAHILLFFGGDLLNLLRDSIAQWRRRQAFRKNSRR